MATIFTKFDIGCKIYTLGDISMSYAAKHTECTICDSTGKINVKGKTFMCPNCGDKRETDWNTFRFRRNKPSTIPKTVGMVTVVNKQGKIEITYMCEETGIGTGKVYQEDECFRTYDEVVKFTEKENMEYERSEIEQYGHILPELDVVY